MATLVKICGLTTALDAREALNVGADWIGLNLVAGPRRIDLQTALDIVAQLPDPAPVVVLLPVADRPADRRTLTRLRDAGVGRLQLYGDLGCDTFSDLNVQGFKTIAVLRAAGRDSFVEYARFLHACADKGPDYVLLDAYHPSSLGGTGARADWDVIQAVDEEGLLVDWPPLILAGGLTPENVTSAVTRLNPFGVDVSSGVESSPGKKDPARVEAFIHAVRGT